jgi:hypothetical protein
MPLEQAPSSNRLFRATLLVWAILIAIVCVRSFLRPDRASVYPIFAEAARSWVRGEDCYRTVLNDVYRYSPPATVLLVPFASLPDSVGGVLWRLVGVSAFLAALLWWTRVVLTSSAAPWTAGAVLWLVIPLTLGNLNNGQSNVLILGALLTASAAVAGGRWNLAAGATTLACLFKGYPLAVPLLFAGLFPRQFAGRFVLALLVGAALPFLCQQPGYVVEQYEGWFDHLRQDDRQQAHLEATYRDVRLLFRLAGAPLPGDVFRVLQVLSGAGVLAVGLLGRRAGWPRRRLAGTALDLGCCWMVLFGPATESNTYVLLAPALAWSLLETARSSRSRMVFGLVALSGGLLLICCVTGWFPVGRQVRALGLQPLAGLLLVGGLLVHLYFWPEPSTREEVPAQLPDPVIACEQNACS